MTAATADRALELDCERTVIEACKVLGFRVHGERAAVSRRGMWATPIKGDAGWPDLVIAGHGHVLVVELKRKPRKVTEDQAAWLAELARAGVSTDVVWVPEGLQPFLQMLAELARKPIGGAR